MNIFFLSLDPAEAAKRHGNKHVIKMILESTQMLITCWHRLNDDDESKWKLEFQNDTGRSPYKMTHANHPCNIWVRASPANYAWLCRLGLALCDEKMRRWPKNREHACRPLLEWLATHAPPFPPDAPEDLTPPARAMPDEFKVDSDDSDVKNVIASYERYYVHKASLGIVSF